MRSFNERRWEPSGSRLHVLVPVPPWVAEYAARVDAAAAEWWAQRHEGLAHEWHEVVQMLREEHLHLTLAWIDTPTADLAPDVLDELHHQLRLRAYLLPRLPIQVGPAIVKSHAIELYVDPDPRLARLAAAARDAIDDTIRDLPGCRAPRRRARPWRAYIPSHYGRLAFDCAGLSDALAYATDRRGEMLRVEAMPVESMIIVDQDTFGPDGFTWDRDSVRTVRLGA